MGENKTVLTESLIIWVSFFCFELCECVAFKGHHESVFAYLFVGGGGGVSTKTIYRLRENETNVNKSG